ncbi:unnamed protein product [Lupinus luteus]|uniref:Mce/MlaD domain-containing protein n=1 Tax=Lupinus luteus TaxID=3873 RepID=A0AAV1WMZ7_LUPLU
MKSAGGLSFPHRVQDDKTIILRNSLIEVNQTGFLMISPYANGGRSDCCVFVLFFLAEYRKSTEKDVYTHTEWINDVNGVREIEACRICAGTSVRIRGVTVGNVIHVNPSLRNIAADFEVQDDKTIILRNSLTEVNQSGFLMVTIIDISFRNPIPTPSLGTLDKNYHKDVKNVLLSVIEKGLRINKE